jgi:hypothetical protein
MSLSENSLEERIGQLKQSRNFWKRLALGQLLLLAIVILAGVTTLSLKADRARRAEMIAREEAQRAREAAQDALQQFEKAAREEAEAEHTAREKDKK